MALKLKKGKVLEGKGEKKAVKGKRGEKGKEEKKIEKTVGRLSGWENNSKRWKSIWHFADSLFRKHGDKSNKEIFSLMEGEVKRDFPQSRFQLRNVAWYRSKFNSGIHPKR